MNETPIIAGWPPPCLPQLKLLLISSKIKRLPSQRSGTDKTMVVMTLHPQGLLNNLGAMQSFMKFRTIPFSETLVASRCHILERRVLAEAFNLQAWRDSRPCLSSEILHSPGQRRYRRSICKRLLQSLAYLCTLICFRVSSAIQRGILRTSVARRLGPRRIFWLHEKIKSGVSGFSLNNAARTAVPALHLDSEPVCARPWRGRIYVERSSLLPGLFSFQGRSCRLAHTNSVSKVYSAPR